MAPEGMRQIERSSPARRCRRFACEGSRAADAGRSRRARRTRRRRRSSRTCRSSSMSTLSFQDYVRDRMLKRRQAALQGEADPAFARRTEREAVDLDVDDPIAFPGERSASPAEIYAAAAASHEHAKAALAAAEERRAEAGLLGQRMAEGAAPGARRARRPRSPPTRSATPTRAGDHADLMTELRSMKGLIEERFGALAFMEKLQRQPGASAPDAEAARLRLLAGADPQARRRPDRRRRRRDRLGRQRARAQPARPARPSIGIEDQGGVFALIGATGVGKTTTTAKIAAAFAARHGAAQPRPDHARRLPRRRPRAAARLRPHPRRAGAHRARPRLARRPARAARRPRRWC